MTTFDASSHPPAHPALGSDVRTDLGPSPGPPAAAEPGAPPEPDGLGVREGDSMELLSRLAREHMAEEAGTFALYTEPARFRVDCNIDIAEAQIKRWQRKAIPKARRNARNLRPEEVEQVVLMSTAIIECAVGFHVLGKDVQWRPITQGNVAKKDGGSSPLEEPAVLGAFGALTADILVRKLWPRDGQLISQGQRLLAKAGWADAAGLDLDDEGIDELVADPTARG